MAYSIRFTGIGHDGRELLSIEPEWWSVSEVQELFPLRWVRTNDTGSYSDDDADVSVEEGRSIHFQFRGRLLKVIQQNTDSLASYASGDSIHKHSIVNSYKKLVSELEGNLQELDAAVANVSGQFAKFHIRVFEWESGF